MEIENKEEQINKMKPRPKTEYHYTGPTEAEIIEQTPEVFVVRSNIGKYYKKFKMNMSYRSVEEINKQVKRIILCSIKRAQRNQRKTVFPRDL